MWCNNVRLIFRFGSTDQLTCKNVIASVSADVFKINDHHYFFITFISVLTNIFDKKGNVNKEMTGAFHIKQVNPNEFKMNVKGIQHVQKMKPKEDQMDLKMG